MKKQSSSKGHQEPETSSKPHPKPHPPPAQPHSQQYKRGQKVRMSCDYHVMIIHIVVKTEEDQGQIQRSR